MSKQRPIYRVKFCPIIGQNDDNTDKLGNAIEIGAVWPRKEASKGAILKLDIVPDNIKSGVILLQPVTATAEGGAQ